MRTLLTTAATAALFAGGVLAQSTGPTSYEEFAEADEETFDIIDFNENAEVDRDEFEQAAQSDAAEYGSFEDYDRNADDVITADEYSERRFEAFDRDDDGMLSGEEYAAAGHGDQRMSREQFVERSNATFDELDRSGDDVIDEEEFEQAWSGDDTGFATFEQLDRNNDDLVNRAEFHDNRFELLDQDQSGYLTADEMHTEMGDDAMSTAARGERLDREAFDDMARTQFERLDISGDDLIDEEEFEQAWSGDATGFCGFEQLDRNDDNEVYFSEYSDRLFQMLDDDNDGYVYEGQVRTMTEGDVRS